MRSKATRISFEERKIIKECIDKGRTQHQIAKMLGRCQGTVCEEISRNSVNGVYDPELAQSLCNKRKSRYRFPPLTEEERLRVFELSDMGHGEVPISKMIGKTTHQVRVVLGRSPARFPQQLPLPFVPTTPSTTSTNDALADRLSIVEMQLQILTETLRDFMKGANGK